MEMMNINTGQEPVTMSSREIAKLCEKRHDHVLRDIEKMLANINDPKFGVVEFEAQYQDSKGELRKEYRLPKDLTVTLITGYRADLRYKVVKRLEELESERQTFDPVKALNDPAVMRHLLLTYSERVLDLEQDVAELTPKAAALDRIATADGSECITDTAKALGMRPKDLFAWLSRNKWIHRRAGCAHWIAYQDKLMRGLLEHKVTEVTRGDGSTRISEQVRVTAKGIALLSEKTGQVLL